MPVARIEWLGIRDSRKIIIANLNHGRWSSLPTCPAFSTPAATSELTNRILNCRLNTGRAQSKRINPVKGIIADVAIEINRSTFAYRVPR
jgi:hypothetical protein